MPNENQTVDILFLSHMHFISGGAESALFDQVRYLKAKGLNVHVVLGAEDQFAQLLRKDGISCSVIFMPWWVRAPNDSAPYQYRTGDPAGNCLAELVRLLQRLKPRLCVTNTIVLPWLAYASAITNTRHVWFIHEIGTKGLNLSYNIGENDTIKTIAMLSDGVFYNSQITAKAYYPTIPREMTLGIIYPGGCPPKPGKIKNPFRTETKLKLVSVGQIKPQKGQLVSAMAVKNLKDMNIDAELIVIGGFEDKKYVEKILSFVSKYGLENNVRLVGYNKNPSSYVSCADACVMSATNEAFGRVTVEAMMLGIPVVGARSGGTVEIIDHGKTGLLFKPSDPADLAAQLKMIAQDEKTRINMGKLAKKIALSNYSDGTRFKPFLDYLFNLDKMPKRALNLSPALSLIDDYNDLRLATERKLALRQIVPRKIKTAIKNKLRKR